MSKPIQPRGSHAVSQCAWSIATTSQRWGGKTTSKLPGNMLLSCICQTVSNRSSGRFLFQIMLNLEAIVSSTMLVELPRLRRRKGTADNAGAGGKRSRTLPGTEVCEVGQGPVSTHNTDNSPWYFSNETRRFRCQIVCVLFLKWILSCEDRTDYEAFEHNSNRNELSGI